MSIYVGNKQAVIYKGDYEPAALYKGETKIAGYTEHEYQGTDIAAENTYRAELGLHLYGKSWQETTTGAQLLDWKTIFTNYNYIDRTVVIENNGYDITISANITEAGSTTSPIYMNTTAYLPDTFAGKTITFSCATWESNVPQEKNKLGLMYRVDGKNHYHGTATNMLIVTIPENATNIYLRFFLIETAARTVPVGTYTAKFTGVMLNYGDTALPWEPYTGGIPSPNPDYPQPINSIGDSGSVDVVVTGKNLIPTNLAQNGISYNADTKRWKFEALSKYGLVNVRIIDPNRGSYILPAGQYTFTAIDKQNMLHTTVSDIGNGWKTLVAIKKTKPSVTFTLTKDTEIGIYVIPEDITQPGYVQIQLERGATATSYQPYREPQTLTINTPNGLCGISVDTGGNYTDSTGQQWICDEIDFERGVYVQRIKALKCTTFSQQVINSQVTLGYLRVYIYDSAAENTKINAYKYVKCDKMPSVSQLQETAYDYPVVTPYGHKDSLELRFRAPKTLYDSIDNFQAAITGCIVIYPLATPIETPLTAAELAAYKAIKSYPHYTRIESAAELGVKLKEY